jgi:hypothetical protein
MRCSVGDAPVLPSHSCPTCNTCTCVAESDEALPDTATFPERASATAVAAAAVDAFKAAAARRAEAERLAAATAPPTTDCALHERVARASAATPTRPKTASRVRRACTTRGKPAWRGIARPNAVPAAASTRRRSLEQNWYFAPFFFFWPSNCSHVGNPFSSAQTF